MYLYAAAGCVVRRSNGCIPLQLTSMGAQCGILDVLLHLSYTV